MISQVIVILSMAFLLVGCSTTRGGEAAKSGIVPGAEVTVDGLRRWQGSGFADTWVRPGVDFTLYSKIILGPVFVSYKRPPRASRGAAARGNFALSTGQMERFKRYLTEVFTLEFEKSQTFQVVKEPGPDVLEVEPSIIDLVVNTPTKAVGRDRYYTTSTADMTLLMELRDSESGELLARIADRRTARSPHGSGLNRVYYSNPISNSQAVRSTFKRWATILVGQLDQLNTLGKDAS